MHANFGLRERESARRRTDANASKRAPGSTGPACRRFLAITGDATGDRCSPAADNWEPAEWRRAEEEEEEESFHGNFDEGLS